MYCRNCGGEINNVNADVCLHCGTFVCGQKTQHSNFYSAGFVLGILSLCIPGWGIILGIIGLPLACISKRKSAIIMNCIGIVLWLSLTIIPYVRFNNLNFDHNFIINSEMMLIEEFEEIPYEIPYDVTDIDIDII
jgi:hypothetical protein